MARPQTRGPVRAGDYGKPSEQPAHALSAQGTKSVVDADIAAKNAPLTDGQKTLSLWSR